MAHAARRIGDAHLTDVRARDQSLAGRFTKEDRLIGRRSESGARSRPVPRCDSINADVLHYSPFGAECCDGD